MTITPPVLLIAFNRSDLCQKVLESIRLAKPNRFFFAVDGPRVDHPQDNYTCTKTRELVKLIDWKCDVKTLFQTSNKGCRFAPYEAISWFFKHVTSGIILEDDCIPSTSFFQFCAELLDLYANNHKVGMISGNNHFGFQSNPNCSYHFSQHPSTWGWATWSRVWKNYDITMNTYRDQFKDIKHRIGSSAKFRNYWWRHVEAVDNGLDTWDVQWAITLLANKQLTIRPKVNLVSNIGFITDSTHTSFDCNHDLFSTKHSIPFPLIHPDSIISDTTADKRTECTITSLQYRLFNFIGSKIPLTKKPLININKVFRKIRGD